MSGLPLEEGKGPLFLDDTAHAVNHAPVLLRRIRRALTLDLKTNLGRVQRQRN